MSSVGSVLGDVAQGAAGGMLSGAAAVGQAIKGIISDFVTDPNKKLDAATRALEIQAQLQMAELDAMTKQTQSANDAAKNDHYLGGARAAFCYGFTALYLFNYSGLSHRCGLTPMDIPANLNFIFAGVMLGCIGIPAMIEGLQNILKMPGESTVAVPGLKASNKS
jgi:hypothetical protein